jgi:hypothetical protein
MGLEIAVLVHRNYITLNTLSLQRSSSYYQYYYSGQATL